MNHRIAAASVMLVFVAGCSTLRAPSRQGLTAMEHHHCREAIDLMQGPASQGDGYSINNLGAVIEAGCPEAGWTADPVRAFLYYRNAAEHGVPIAFSNAGALLEFGKVSAPDPDSAAVLYREGARYGDENSITGLERLGRPVPAVDRVAPAIAERRQKQLDFALLVAGVMVERQTALPRATPLPAPPRLPVHVPSAARQPTPPIQVPSPAAVTVAGRPTCRNSTDCHVGQSCVVPDGQVTGLGVCATPTEGGMAVIPAPRLMPVSISSCQFDTQCPAGFKCERVRPADLNGLCAGPASAQTLFR
jgi:hypothetical protein